MAYRVRKVNYCKLMVPSRAGQGEKILGALRGAGINLHAFTGFPAGGGKSQVDLVSDDITGIRRLAKKEGWRLSDTNKAFLVQGGDEIGAIHRVIKRLAEARINVIAADAVAAGAKRYGMILWVRPKDYRAATRVLNAK